MRESGRRLILGKRLAETEQIEELIIGKAISDEKDLAPGVHGISFAGKPLRAVLDMFSLMHFVTRSLIDIIMLLLIQQASHGQQLSATDVLDIVTDTMQCCKTILKRLIQHRHRNDVSAILQPAHQEQN